MSALGRMHAGPRAFARGRRRAPVGPVLVAALTLLIGVLAARPAAGQVLTPEKGLEFGLLQPGVATRISPDHPNRAAISIFGLGRMSIRLVTPGGMTSPNGGTIPLDIVLGDAVVRWWTGSSQLLTPGGTTQVNGVLFGNIYIGGTARPSWDQGAGTYSGTIILQIGAAGT